MRSRIQFTLRELLVVIAFAALGLAALSTGGVIGSIVVSLAMIVTMGLAIVAFVGRRSRQAFAIGFLIPVIVNATVMLVAGKSEFDLYAGQLPTTRLLRPMCAMVFKVAWYQGGIFIPGYDRDNDPNHGAGMTYLNSPQHETFMKLGHILIAMTLGYAGAKFAVIVHRRESKENE